MNLSVVRFINILLAALLAGTSFGIWMGYNPVHFSPLAYLEQQQNMVQELNVLMPSMVILATIVTALSAFLQRRNRPVFISLIIAATFFIAGILISKFGNQPINTMVMSWTPDSTPGNWTKVRDDWWSLHIMRTIAELIALSLVTWVSIRRD